MKTAVTVLQEMMIKQGKIPEYECIAQSGPQHQATFEYRCMAYGVSVTAIARSKKEAKQEAARIMLLQLEERGYSIPPPFCRGGAPVHGPLGAGGGCAADAVPTPVGPLSARSYVALLRELCEEYRLPAVEYELTSDTGPSHARHFTIRARLGMHERHATSTTKKFARQLAAEQLYTYLKENLARVTKDFVEDEALARAHEKAMDRYVEIHEDRTWKPNLGQKVADYHIGLLTDIGEEKRAAALAILVNSSGEDVDAEETLARVAAAMGLSVERRELPAHQGALHVVALGPATPALAMAGHDPPAAARASLRYLRRCLGTP